MKFVIESEGTLVPDSGSVLDDRALQLIFDRVADELVRLNEFEADVGLTSSTGAISFYLVVDAPTPMDAISKADGIVTEALMAAGVSCAAEWVALHARRADLISA